MSQNNRKTQKGTTAKVWMYLSMIVLLSQAHTAHSSSIDFAVSSPVMNNVIASYSGQSLSCSSSPNAFPTACAVTHNILTSNSGQNIATSFPAANSLMNQTINTYTGVNCFPPPPPSSAIIFGSSSAALNVTINNNTSGSNFFTSGSGEIIATGNPSVSVFPGSTDAPFVYTPDGAITFTADATAGQGVVINGDMHLYGDLIFAVGTKLTVNGDLYIDSSAGNNVITCNNGTLTVTGTIYIRGNGSNQTNLGGNNNLSLTNQKTVIDQNGILHLSYNTLNLLGTSTLNINTSGKCSVYRDNIYFSTLISLQNSSTLTINDGGMLTIDNTGNSNQSAGLVSLINNAALIINNGGILMMDNSGSANEGGKLNCGDSSTLTINTGGILTINKSGSGTNGGLLTISPSSTLNIQNDSTLSIDTSAQLQLTPIGKITINSIQVANVTGYKTYTITGSTPTLTLRDENGNPVSGANPITIPATIVTGPYVA